jgi:hypothetical protein
MNTDKTNGFPNLSLIRDNPCNPWLNKTRIIFYKNKMLFLKTTTQLSGQASVSSAGRAP